ncbi:putative bifunctional diguanylate cyclase/phosphodiesterase [Acidithiobacillus sulfuriphilus]|uniref:EAL domain-containing protein n=2 Tax=Acidithiobacillus sulfuriphilus TaxID=1867749 RepID=A0ACD5HJZ7_9PROT|nr:EAL domain-containing protein [Acidithiobacillus sulfuriphilus]
MSSRPASDSPWWAILGRLRVFLVMVTERFLSQSYRSVLWESNVFFVVMGVTFIGIALWQATVLEQAIQAGFSTSPRSVLLTNSHGQVISSWKDGHWAPPEPNSSPAVGMVAISVPGSPKTLHIQWASSSARQVFWRAERKRLPILLTGLLLIGVIGWFSRYPLRQLMRLRQYQAITLLVQRDLLREKNPQAMYQRLVDNVVAQTEAIGAYVIARELEDPFLTIQAMADADDDPLFDRAAPVRYPVQGICPTIVADEVFRTGLQQGPLNPSSSAMTQDVDDDRSVFDRVRSVMAIPVFVGGGETPFAVLVIESEEIQHFTQSLQETLKQLATSLGFGLTHYRERRELEQAKAEIENLARHDMLTHLPNRRFLEEQLEQAITRAERHGKLLAVCMLDLDGFKPVNDTYGHEAGDEVLVTLGKRLLKILRKSDFVARLGGDEFVLLVENLSGPNDLNSILTKVEKAINAPIPLSNGEIIQIGWSMGISLYPFGKEGTGDQLLRSADHALYESKAHKADRSCSWVYFGEDTVWERQRTPAQQLLSEGALEVWYQPILSGGNHKVVGVEALARLRDDDGRILYPAEFLPQLSVDDLSNLSMVVLAQALEDLKKLDNLGWQLWVSFNVAPESFGRAWVSCLQSVIDNSGVYPKRITLEILEGGNFLERNVALSVLHEIKGMGIRLALDDVGSAYASLLRLKDIPIDEIKLDQCFIRSLGERPQDLHFVRTIHDLASELQLDMVVEGVETTEILDAMLTTGVSYLQGYAISRPLPLAVLQQFLSSYTFDMGKHPATLFGLYAGILKFHTAVKKILSICSTQLDIARLTDCRQYYGHNELHRFGYGDDSHMVQLLNDYHIALGAVANDIHNCSAWAVMESALNKFQQAIMDARQ